MAESLFILELEFLHIRGGCSLIIVFFIRDSSVQFPISTLASFPLQILLCLLPLALHLGLLRNSQIIKFPFISFSLFSFCTALSSSVKVYCLSFLSLQGCLWRAMFAMDFTSPQCGQILLATPVQNVWCLLIDVFCAIAVLVAANNRGRLKQTLEYGWMNKVDRFLLPEITASNKGIILMGREGRKTVIIQCRKTAIALIGIWTDLWLESGIQHWRSDRRTTLLFKTYCLMSVYQPL